MSTSAQLTQDIIQSNDSKARMRELFLNARYFISQTATGDADVTRLGWYQGRIVYHANRAHNNFPKMEHINRPEHVLDVYHITFIDYEGTDDANDEMVKANYTIMSDEDADAYEAAILAELKSRDNLRITRSSARK